MEQKSEFSIWVWNKLEKKFIPMLSVFDSYDGAITALEKYNDLYHYDDLKWDFEKFQIKKRIISYSAYEVFYG